MILSKRLSGFAPDFPDSQSFSYSGSVQTFTVPSGVSSVTVKMWGAGGGGPKDTDSGTRTGGAGGYAAAVIDVSSFSSLDVYVGEGGLFGPSNTGLSFGFGGGGNGEGGGQGGGGTSLVSDSGVTLIVAGGGGGSGATDDNFFAGDASGGAGGGTNAQDGLGASIATGASGATPGVGGENGFDGNPPDTNGGEGGAAGGGTGDAGGGGGGGGYAGGGGGGGGNLTAEGGGGGGSAFANSSFASSITLTTGNRKIPGNSGDADRPSGVAIGGGVGQSGGNGFVLISWS